MPGRTSSPSGRPVHRTSSPAPPTLRARAHNLLHRRSSRPSTPAPTAVPRSTRRFFTLTSRRVSRSDRATSTSTKAPETSKSRPPSSCNSTSHTPDLSSRPASIDRHALPQTKVIPFFARLSRGPSNASAGSCSAAAGSFVSATSRADRACSRVRSRSGWLSRGSSRCPDTGSETEEDVGDAAESANVKPAGCSHKVVHLPSGAQKTVCSGELTNKTSERGLRVFVSRVGTSGLPRPSVKRRDGKSMLEEELRRFASIGMQESIEVRSNVFRRWEFAPVERPHFREDCDKAWPCRFCMCLVCGVRASQCRKWEAHCAVERGSVGDGLYE